MCSFWYLEYFAIGDLPRGGTLKISSRSVVGDSDTIRLMLDSAAEQTVHPTDMPGIAPTTSSADMKKPAFVTAPVDAVRRASPCRRIPCWQAKQLLQSPSCCRIW